MALTPGSPRAARHHHRLPSTPRRHHPVGGVRGGGRVRGGEGERVCGVAGWG